MHPSSLPRMVGRHTRVQEREAVKLPESQTTAGFVESGGMGRI